MISSSLPARNAAPCTLAQTAVRFSLSTGTSAEQLRAAASAVTASVAAVAGIARA